MRRSRKALLGGVAAMAAGSGYLVGKKRAETKTPYRKALSKLEDIFE